MRQRHVALLRDVDRTATRRAVRVVAACAAALLLVSVAAPLSGASAYSGVSCSVGPSSVTVSWTGEFRARQYTAYVRNAAGSEVSQVVDWRSKSQDSASAEFTGLALGAYSVRVVMQTVDGSWYEIGDSSCTVTTATTTTTTTSPPTTTAPSSGSSGSLSCTTSASSITVTLDPAEGTTSWEVWATHSSGYPRLSQLIPVHAGEDEDLSHEFTSVAQGTWTVDGTAVIDGTGYFGGGGTRETLTAISCTVAGGL